MNAGVAINALTVEDSYTGAQLTEYDTMKAPFDPYLTNQWKGAFQFRPHMEIEHSTFLSIFYP